jgi:asparagine synthase (glutamine-hydrolysing)
MCGIFSLWSRSAPVNKIQFGKSLDTLTHRGPDGCGTWFSADGHVALGHRRLSIIDLATGAQPLANEDNSIHLAMNGELYDFAAIRTGLEQKGHYFATHSDSEIALHLYEEYGLDFFSHLRGEFSFILYDGRQKRLVAARDRFGIKPLCYAQDKEGNVYIASEAKAIIAAGYPAAWDRYSFFHACNVQYVPPDRTLFKGIHQVPPGHVLVYDGRDIVIKKYWDLNYPELPEKNSYKQEDYIRQFQNGFSEAVRLRLQADVSVCCHLSGGLDSSAVAAMAMKHAGKPLDCFTVSFSQEGYDEEPIAREMAEKMGAPLHVVSVSQDDLVHVISDAVYYSEGLAINGHLAGKYLLNKAIRAAGFKVALTGEGSDEILAGYPHLREDLLQHGADADAAGKLAQLYQSNDKLAGVFLAQGDTLSVAAVEQAMGFVPAFLRAKASLGLRVCSVLSDEFLNEFDNTDIYADVINGFDVPGQLRNRHVVDQSLYLWTKLTLANYILRTLGDGCEMAHAVEGRVPFLDHHLFELARSLPLDMKIRDMVEKYVLREAVRPLVTDTIYRRQKHPFIAPPVSRFSSAPLMGYIQDMLRSRDFASMPFFDQGKVLGWLDALPRQTPQEKVAAEPVLMMVLTSFLIHQGFSPS